MKAYFQFWCKGMVTTVLSMRTYHPCITTTITPSIYSKAPVANSPDTKLASDKN